MESINEIEKDCSLNAIWLHNEKMTKSLSSIVAIGNSFINCIVRTELFWAGTDKIDHTMSNIQSQNLPVLYKNKTFSTCQSKVDPLMNIRKTALFTCSNTFICVVSKSYWKM